ncbi:hypothetical protein Sjap_021534 [Stephania japonica]|uniref:AAA+ ATPase domain-containing protein n=1 Tax=Stephania japonica TaxID=461633 RepID=A0AAP0EQA9_9MAGN
MKEEESAAAAMPLEECERKTPRRRLVQSTLFPHRPRRDDEEQADRPSKGDEGVQGEGEGEEECCRSQKKKIKRKAKAETKTATKTKRTTPKKALDNGNDALGSAAENINSVDATSKRSPPEQVRQEDASPSAFQTPQKLKRPYRRKTMVNCNSDTLKDVVQPSDRSPQAVFDLRLEAKLAAEENARMSTGKQTHPFFSLWKVGKNCQRTSATAEVENKQCSLLPDSESNILHPIHVFEMRQDDSVSLDWKNWKFCDDYSLDSTSPENQCSSLFERLTEPLKLDTCPAITNFNGIHFRPDASILSHFPTQVEDADPVIPEISPDAGQPSQNLKDLELHQIYHDCNLDHPQEGFLHGRTMPYHCCHGDQLESSLWTDKYQPKKASEVCGNNESVQFLNEWLGSWRERYSGVGKNSICDKQYIEYSLEEGDLDTESMDGTCSRNVLLVTGPVGSGKSAAIYACASEQGFEVIEVSASDWRNGAHVKQKFGAGLESLGLNKWSRSLIGSVNSKRKDAVDFLDTQQSNSSLQEVDNGEVELILELCKEDIEQSSVTDIVKDNISDCRGADKTLILFEDVDIVFEEDRGFISTIQQMAETTKWPMILTSNSKDPELPDQLNRRKLCFASPAPKELFSLLDMVCATEYTSVQPQLLELLIGCCHGDIRKSLMLLQFWCQGNWNNSDRKLESASGPLQFDLDVGHELLPNIFPGGFSSQLSEILEKEISKVLCGVKENTSLLEVVKDDESSDQETQDDFTMVIRRKKEAMLNMNYFSQDANAFSTQFDSVADLSNSSGSPFAFTRRTARQRANTVFSSCSGDEFIGNDSLVDLNIQPGEPSNGALLDGIINLPPYRFPAEGCADIYTDQLHHSDRIILEEELYNCSQEEEKQLLHDTLRSIDVSCVPESSFVPETEIENGVELPSKTVSCGHFPFTTDVSSRALSFQSPTILDNKHDDNTIAMPFKILQTTFESTNNMVGESVHGDEEVGDSQNGHPTVLRSFQVMDECSRADFNRASISGSGEDPWCLLRTHSVQNLWKKLRAHHEGLKLHATSEDRKAAEIVRVAAGTTDLLSMADLLYSCCSSLDSFDATVATCIEPNVSYCYDEQLKMTSTMVEHGFCYFAKESTARESHLGLKNEVDSEQGKLPRTINTKVEGTVVAPESSMISQKCAYSEKQWPRTDVSLEREIKVHLYDMIQNVVPSKLYLASKGAAFHEYLSSLGHISKLEASRVFEGINNTKRRRRTRAGNNYLITGPLTLSPEDVSFLARQTCYGKAQLATTNTSYR